MQAKDWECIIFQSHFQFHIIIYIHTDTHTQIHIYIYMTECNKFITQHTRRFRQWIWLKSVAICDFMRNEKKESTKTTTKAPDNKNNINVNSGKLIMRIISVEPSKSNHTKTARAATKLKSEKSAYSTKWTNMKTVCTKKCIKIHRCPFQFFALFFVSIKNWSYFFDEPSPNGMGVYKIWIVFCLDYLYINILLFGVCFSNRGHLVQKPIKLQ